MCQRPGFDVFAGHPKKMGNRGVMIAVESVKPKNATEGIHKALLAGMKKGQDHDEDLKGAPAKGEEKDRERLTNQDLMKLVHPHVTIMNKADSDEEVNKCLEEIEKLFKGMEGGGHKGRAVGFEL